MYSVVHALIFSSRHSKTDKLYPRAYYTWSKHCEESGSWHENPQLLNEILKMLDSCEGQKILDHIHSGTKFLAWFLVRAVPQPILLFSKLTLATGRSTSPASL